MENEIDIITNDIKGLFEKGLFTGRFDEKRWNELQKPVMEDLLKENSNVIGLLPTAAGKSLLYQYFAWFKSEAGVIIVIEPLQSIIKDQIEAFNDKNINGKRAASVTEYLSDSDSIPTDISIVYTSPELLFRYTNRLSCLVKDKTIAIQMIVVDELHTMFEWGSSFRSEFLYIPTFINIIRAANPELKVLSLTATLTKIEMSLCRVFLGAEDREVKTPELPSDKKVKFIKEFKFSDTYDSLMDIIVPSDKCSPNERGLNLQTIGIAFFKKKESINRFVNKLVDTFKTRRKFRFDAKNRLIENVYDFQQINSMERVNYGNTAIRRLVTYTGDLKSEAKRELLKIIDEQDANYDFRVYVLATKALAMGVDLKSINEIRIIGIPESWNCFLQEIGRVRNEGGRYIAYYSSSDARQMMRELIASQKKNPLCVYDPFVNVMERIKTWDYLCLWEWYLDSIKNGGKVVKSVPDDVDISLEELLEMRPKDIRNKLNGIIKEDSKKAQSVDAYIFDDIFKQKWSFSDLKLNPFICMNVSKAFISFNKNYPGIFSGGKARFEEGNCSLILWADQHLNFFDYMVFNALYSYRNYSTDGKNADKYDILEILFGRNCECEDLLGFVEKSLRKLQEANISGKTHNRETGEKEELYSVKLYENGTFPIFDFFPQLQDQIVIAETAKIRYLFDAIKGEGGKNLTAVNLIAIHYTLFGIERHKMIRRYGYSANEGKFNFNVFSLPFKPATIDDALTEWLKHNKTSEEQQLNKSQEYIKLIKKMKKISVVELKPDLKHAKEEEIDEEYKKIVNKANNKLTPPKKSEDDLIKMKSESKEKWDRRCDRWNGYVNKKGKEIRPKKEKWEEDKKDKLILYIR